jgi:Flp pilus assembly protein TadG
MALRTHHAQRGDTLIEFAWVLPALIWLFCAIIDVGILFFKQHTVQFATREGVRLALVGRTLSDPSGNPLSREASIIKKIDDNAAVAAVKPAELLISIYPVDPSTYTDPANWQNTVDAGSPGEYMRVRTRYYYNFITPGIGAFFGGGKFLIEAEATYRNELFQ